MRIVFHELTPALCDDGALASRADELAAVASRVAVVHDWGLSFGTVEGATSSLGPLLAGFGPADYRALRGRLKPAGAWPTWTVEELPDAASARPDRILAALLGKRGTLAQAAVHPYAWQLPVRIKLYTNRGGWWPERRSRPEGTVAGGDLESVALARFGAGADDLVTAMGRADDLVAGLRAG
jgi:hypothetical protein